MAHPLRKFREEHEPRRESGIRLKAVPSEPETATERAQRRARERLEEICRELGQIEALELAT